MLTVKEVEQALPKHIHTTISQEMVDQLNNLSSDPIHAEHMRDNFISFTNVLSEGKFKLEDYVCAVVYVSYKIMGYSNQESYSRTFPTRYQNLVNRGATSKDISAYVSGYNKNKLVNLIMDRSLIPTWVLNQDVFQKAINTQAELMMTAQSEKVRSDAANSLLTHLKKPEVKEVELNIGVKDTSGMNELKDTLRELAEQQQSLINKGMSTKEIAHQKLIPSEEVIDAEYVKNG